MKKQIPNIFTLLNLLAGCMAIVTILQQGIDLRYDYESDQFKVVVTERIWMASFFIALAAVIDFLDGFVARWLNAVSELGKQLDSLADVVSFGVAPSMIVLQFLRLGFAEKTGALDAPFWWLIPAFLPAMAAAYRLGRFNLDNSQTSWFKGLPVPAAGIMTAALPLIYWNEPAASIVLMNPIYMVAYSLLLSGLMISKWPMMSFKFTKGSPVNLARIILVLAAAVGFVFLSWMAAPVVFLLYIVLSFVYKKYAS